MESRGRPPWKSVSVIFSRAQFALSFGLNTTSFEKQRACRGAALIRPSDMGAAPLPTRSCRTCVCTICRTRTSYCRAPVETRFSCICRYCSCIDSCACRGTTRVCIYCFPRSSRRAYKLRRCPTCEQITRIKSRVFCGPIRSRSKQLLLRVLRVNVLYIQIPVAIFVG